MKKLALLVLVLLLVPTSVASAITPARAKQKAQLFQYKHCHIYPYTCINAIYIPARCGPAHKGEIQFTCEGVAEVTREDDYMFCLIESSWSEYGRLVHSYKACYTASSQAED
jgi:hypothetical protein